MICPQNKAERKSPTGCGAMGCSVLEDNPPPKPTMQEIEGLLGEYVGWCIEANEGGLKDSLANDAVDAARAALMAAIRQLSNSTQDGE